MSETLVASESTARLPVLFHKHPQQLGEQLSQLLPEHPDVNPGDYNTLDELGRVLGGVVFDVWDLMDLNFKARRDQPEA